TILSPAAPCCKCRRLTNGWRSRSNWYWSGKSEMTLGEPCTMAISESHVLGSVGSASFESRDAPISLRVLSQSLGVGWILRSAPDKMYRSQTMCFSSAIADEPLTSLLLARNSSLVAGKE